MSPVLASCLTILIVLLLASALEWFAMLRGLDGRTLAAFYTFSALVIREIVSIVAPRINKEREKKHDEKNSTDL